MNKSTKSIALMISNEESVAMNVPAAIHPTDQTLNDYGLGKLDDSSSSAIESHLETCADCRGRLSGPSSDTFLARLRDAQGGLGRSVPAMMPLDGTISMIQARPPTASPPAADSLPSGLADHTDYEIRRELGRGGMGVVYLAHNTMMGRDEVLKVMSRHLIERPGVLERFQREIRAVAKLRHPNIVAAHTAFRIEGGLVFAMEYVEGLDLARLVKAKGPLPVAHAAYFIHQAALGLQHAHEKEMVHRDIKPHNLMLTHDGKARVVKVLDFGLAKASREQKVDGALTSEGQALGTPDYIAPEQILDAASADIRADLYSLGGTLFYLLTGRPPFQATSLYDMYQAHISRDVEPLNLLRPEVPAELAALVSKMMAKDPSRRFQTPGEVAQALLPFFKKTNPAPKNPEMRVSERIGSTHPQRVVEAAPAPTKTVSERSQVPTKKTKPIGGDPSWESLINVGDREDSTVEPGLLTLKRRPPWTPKTKAIAAGFLGLVAMLGVIIIITIKHPDGGETRFTLETIGNAKPNSEPRDTKLAKQPVDQVQPSPEPRQSQFVPLFNGKNLEGWTDIMPNGSEWIVDQNGILIGRGGGGLRPAVLLTKRQDFTNFRLRAKVRYPEAGFGWIELRRKTKGTESSGYFVATGAGSEPERVSMGSVCHATNYQYGTGHEWKLQADMVHRTANTWYTIDITAVANRVVIFIDEKKICEYLDMHQSYSTGAIALACQGVSAVEFQEVLIDILPDGDRSPKISELDRSKPEKGSNSVSLTRNSEKASSLAPPSSDGFDPNATYQFSNNWLRGKSLDIGKDGKNDDQPVVTETSERPGQQWRIIPLGGGWCRITNEEVSGKSLAITDNNQPVLADTGDHPSQQWKITPGGGWYRITNRRLSGRALDIINDGKNNRLKMETGNWTGQFWKIIRLVKESDTIPPTAGAAKASIPEAKAKSNVEAPRNLPPSFRWTGKLGSAQYFELKPDGTIVGWQGNVTGSWEIDGSFLTFRWPSSAATGGVWIDKTEISGDGSFAAGKNQEGHPVKFYSVR